MSAFKKLNGIQELEQSVHDKQTLLTLLKNEISSYSVFDLIKIQGFLENECRFLPPVYKKLFKAKMSDHLFSNYKAILSNIAPCDQSLNMDQYRDFLEGFHKRLDNLTADDVPQLIVLYHLCAMYNIFISHTPPHPEGTPFPGGFVVEKIEEEYYCPVKDKQMDNDEALCRFCVAKQSQI